MEPILRDAVAEINLGNLRHNIRQVKKKIGDKKIIAVVKGNAYGHGVVPVSRVFEEEGVDYFGVAILEEALALRQYGTEKPILVQSSIDCQRVEEVVRYNLTLALSDLETARALSSAALRLNKQAVVHIKVDTGLHRFGVFPKDVPDFVKEVSRLEGIYIEGIYTHLAASKATGEDYARMQVNRFVSVLEELKQIGYILPLRHIACSTALVEFPECLFDIVRVGTAFYGIKHIEGIDLKPVMSLKSRVCFIKKVPAGSYISYGMKYRTERETLLVVINMGYADGLPRALYQEGQVLIRGKRFRFAGIINMNNAIIDVGDEDISVGEEVVIMGRQGQEVITNDEIANKLQTSPSELPVRISETVPRVYVEKET